MRDMILTKAGKVYGDHQPIGHGFAVPEKEARLWEALGRAKAATDDGPSDQPMQIGEQSELDALRAEFKSRTGHDADPSWSIGRLKNELRRAGGKYSRRDMRAEG
jgi:hypothetical protein